MQAAFYTIQWVTNKEGMIANESNNDMCRSSMIKSYFKMQLQIHVQVMEYSYYETKLKLKELTKICS